MTSMGTSRGLTWLERLSGQSGLRPDGPPSVRCADAQLGLEPARFLAVVPDPAGRFPRARNGEVGLEEGWNLARCVREAMAADAGGIRRPLVAVVDLPSQAYGRREELLGISLACAAAVDAYASARMAGHPVVALLVGHAMSGAFLAHGYQANRILALDDPGVLVHAMGKAAAARVTRRSVAELDALAATVPPMSYSIRDYARLGLLHGLIRGVAADDPNPSDLERVRSCLIEAVAHTRAGVPDLGHRLAAPEAQTARAASIEVRRRMAEQWEAAGVPE
jgi:malonate decarboxylase gamma subunit